MQKLQNDQKKYEKLQVLFIIFIKKNESLIAKAII